MTLRRLRRWSILPLGCRTWLSMLSIISVSTSFQQALETSHNLAAYEASTILSRPRLICDRFQYSIEPPGARVKDIKACKMAFKGEHRAILIANILIVVAISIFSSGFFPYKSLLPGLATFAETNIGTVAPKALQASLATKIRRAQNMGKVIIGMACIERCDQVGKSPATGVIAQGSKRT